jgi:DNA-binding LacI/PurR family transcriptional regulator
MSTSQPRRSGRPTIAEVAALAGVSAGAVSKVFNGTGRISAATQERVRQAARTLNWRPSATASALRTARTRTIGLVLSSSGPRPEIGAGNVDFLSGIESVLQPRRYGLLLNFELTGQDDEEEFYRTLTEQQRMDGLILTNSRVGDTRFALLRELGMPTVLVGTPWRENEVDFIDSDPPDAGIAEAVEHLVALGHRRIAYLSGPEHFVLPMLRRESFVRTLGAHGLQPHSVAALPYSPQAAAEETRRLVGARNRPTAFIYGTDAMAIAGIRTLQSLGIRVPHDASVIGHEGLSIGEWIDPQLTTVQRFGWQRGRAAAAKLLTVLGQDVDEDVPLERPMLIVRSSTAPPLSPDV